MLRPSVKQHLVRMCIEAYYENRELSGEGVGVTANEAVIAETWRGLGQTDRWRAFVDLGCEEVLVVAFRGTRFNSTEDLVCNVHAFSGCAFRETAQFKKEWESLAGLLIGGMLLQGARTVVFCGHSLGVVFADAARATFCEEFPEHAQKSLCIGFNSATTPHVALPKNDDRSLHFLVDQDPVSAWPDSLRGHVVQVPAHPKESPLQRHTLVRMLHRNLAVPRKLSNLIVARTRRARFGARCS